jgi:hypothetical protein
MMKADYLDEARRFKALFVFAINDAALRAEFMT